MRQKIEFRELKRKDKKELRRLLIEQEGYAEFFEKDKDAETYAKAVLEQCLRLCTYRKVATVGDRVVGAIIGNKKIRSSSLANLKKKVCDIRLKMRKKNREALSCLSSLEETEQRLLRENQADNENLIVLFLTEKRYEKTQVQETLLREWEEREGRQEKSCSHIVLNGKIVSHFWEEHSFLKLEETSVMIQPREQRFRFYKALYTKKDS